MLNFEEAQELMDNFISLRTTAKESKLPEDIKKFRDYETMCIEKFSYIITMKTAKYKSFANYDDLNQEGYEALVKGMKNYNPKKGNIFWWLHRYTATKISRAANFHTTIRYPMKIAKETTPHKETIMPLLIDNIHRPDTENELDQQIGMMQNSMTHLSDNQKEIVALAYGLTGNKPMSINRICRKFSLTRAACLKIINESLKVMRENFTK